MQVLLVLINKGRLCIYFCSLGHLLVTRMSPPADKAPGTPASETCFCHLGARLFAFILSLTHTQTHTQLPLFVSSSSGNFPGAGCFTTITITTITSSAMPPASPQLHLTTPGSRNSAMLLGKERVEIYSRLPNCHQNSCRKPWVQPADTNPWEGQWLKHTKSHKELCQAQLAGLHHSHQQNTHAQHTEMMEMMLRTHPPHRGFG